jgi:histidinol-phosphatase
VSDLETALAAVDAADVVTRTGWSPGGVPAKAKVDGSPVTEVDSAAERAVASVLLDAHPEDTFLGEETGEQRGSSGRRWIVDGIDGTSFFAAGQPTWGTLIALEADGDIVLGVVSSPVLERRWWAVRGAGAFTVGDSHGPRRLQVSDGAVVDVAHLAVLPGFDRLSSPAQERVRTLACGVPADVRWCQQMYVAEGAIDAAVWYCGDPWDHAAPSVIVEEAGGRFSDHAGGRRLDTRTAIYSNGLTHDALLAGVQAVTS